MNIIESIEEFEYPREFDNFKHIMLALVKNKYYSDENIKIELFIGNAREYLNNLQNIDVVYQDAFSSDVNKELWTVEYFKQIYNLCSKDSILTTYSIATPVRLSLFEAGFEIYEIHTTGKKKQTIALKKQKKIEAKYIDMNLKKQRNKEAKAIYD